MEASTKNQLAIKNVSSPVIVLIGTLVGSTS